MTEAQKLLEPYVTARINAVISEKEKASVVPAGADKTEILRDIHKDLKAVMAHLYMEGVFEGHHGINHSFFTKPKA